MDIDMDTKYVTPEGEVIDWQKKPAKGLFIRESTANILAALSLGMELGWVDRSQTMETAINPELDANKVMWRYI